MNFEKKSNKIHPVHPIKYMKINHLVADYNVTRCRATQSHKSKISKRTKKVGSSSTPNCLTSFRAIQIPTKLKSLPIASDILISIFHIDWKRGNASFAIKGILSNLLEWRLLHKKSIFHFCCAIHAFFLKIKSCLRLSSNRSILRLHLCWKH